MFDLSELSSWNPIVGKPFETVNNSKFCDASLLGLYNEFLQKSQVGNTVNLVV